MTIYIEAYIETLTQNFIDPCAAVAVYTYTHTHTHTHTHTNTLPYASLAHAHRDITRNRHYEA